MAVGLRCKGGLTGTREICYNIERSGAPYSIYIDEIQDTINKSEWLVGFNLKFDLHWLRRYGIQIPHNIKVWDIQLGHHILTHQLTRYPSLDGVSDHYGNPKKLDYIKINYWDRGIDTSLVPWSELETYLIQDLNVTEINLVSQLTDSSLTLKKKNLIELAGIDLLALEEIEWNGLPYDTRQSLKESDRLSNELSNIDSKLNDVIGSSIVLNYGSTDDRSILLYGGTIIHETYTPYVKKDGTVSNSRRTVHKKNYIFPQLVKPPKGSELKKKGIYSTDEGTLKKCVCSGKARIIINLFLQRSKLIRLNSTYFKGLPNLIEEMEWMNDTIHGSLNQCVAVTGRLSSDQPNLQNNPEEVDRLFKSRFS